MFFEWDDHKNILNKRKHRIRFETAAEVFYDPYLVSVPDDHDQEERWRSIGLVENVIIYIAYTIKVNHDEEEIIRIISARKATSHESERYWAFRQNEKRIKKT